MFGARLCSFLVSLCCALVPHAHAGAVQKAVATTRAAFVDSFNQAHDADPQYGLNDGLAARQTGAVSGITYSRVPGLWYPGEKTGDPLRPWHSQVNHPKYPNALSMHLRTSAVRLDAPVVNDGAVNVGATLTPVVGSNKRGEWASLVLGGSVGSHGYVSDADSIGVLVTAAGKVQIFQYGKLSLNRQLTTVPADGKYTVRWQISGSTMTLTINNQKLTVAVTKALPANAWLFMGRYSDNRDVVTTFDGLSVSKVDPAHLQGGPVNTNSNLRYYGYFGARIESVPGNHLSDVNGFSNLNWVSISDSNGYQADELAKCAPGSCIVNTRWQFFTDCPGADCRLRSDAQQQWNTFAAAIRQYADRIGGFALMDEAYYQGASAADVSASADMIKTTFPDKKVLLNFAAPSVSATAVIPRSVDWVAYDQYCKPMTDVEKTLGLLEKATAQRPDVQLFVYTESARNLCGTTKSDATIAALQWDYYRLALRHPRVAGLFAFGLWTNESSLSPLVATIDAEQRIAARIV